MLDLIIVLRRTKDKNGIFFSFAKFVVPDLVKEIVLVFEGFLTFFSSL